MIRAYNEMICESANVVELKNREVTKKLNADKQTARIFDLVIKFGSFLFEDTKKYKNKKDNV